MKPIEPTGLPGTRIVLAEKQPQYDDLVAHTTGVRVYTRWSLDETERKAILDGANIELITWTFGQRFQPVYLRVQGVENPAEYRSEVEQEQKRLEEIKRDIGPGQASSL